MIPEIGHFALILCLALSIVQGVVPLIGAAKGNRALMAVARPAAIANALFGTIAFGCLAYSFYVSDFSVLNVANNSNSMLPWYYKVAATWGSHEGSILFWVVTLGWWSAAVAFSAKKLPAEMTARVTGVMGLVAMGFLTFMLFTSNPFLRLFPAPADDLLSYLNLLIRAHLHAHDSCTSVHQDLSLLYQSVRLPARAYAGFA